YVFNLEYPITTRVRGWPGKVNLKATRSYIEQTFGRVPIAVCQANNHTMDYGEDGFTDTQRELRRLGVPGFGAGRLDANAGNPLFLAEWGVALLGYACPSTSAVLAAPEQAGAGALELDRIARDIGAARASGARRVVVSLHWGEEEVPLPKPSDVATARAIVEAGADLVVGHHAHCVQSFEQYQGRHIFYGLGNCIMPDLDQPSYFDEAGQPTRRFIKSQHWWNRRSLAVRYDVETSDVTIRELFFDGASLRAQDGRSRRYELRAQPPAQYAASYRRAFSIGKLRTKVMTYLSHPRRPQVRHLRSLVAIAREVRVPRGGADPR
ncbi:MAG TPA: CapA family protein, partial [Vicinamibacterales bacterium]|nr:CapA family protein [Vicinamibacterales bacterium]